MRWHFKLVPSHLPLLPEAWGNFSLIFTVGTWLKCYRQKSRKHEGSTMNKTLWSFQLSYLSTPSPQQFVNYCSGSVPLSVSACESCSSKPGRCILQSVSPILGAVVFPVASSLMDPRGIVDFSVCSAFHSLGWSSNFQALYVQNWKPEVGYFKYFNILIVR